jgi:AMP nucleosidase
VRDDHVLDDVLPPEIPLPAIAEVQQALAAAAEEVSGSQGSDLKQRMRTGTVVTTDDRNWELRYTSTALRPVAEPRGRDRDGKRHRRRARATASACPTARCCACPTSRSTARSSCPGQANKFYEQAIAAHLQIGIRACELLRAEGPRLHSRKLRAFNEPPFR